MKIFRARYDNVPESPVRTLYGRKGNLLLMPLDVCILQRSNGTEEFRPPEAARLIAAPIQEQGGGRLGVIARYEWPPRPDALVNPVVIVQLAPSANIKGVPDLRVLASQVNIGDKIVLTGGSSGDRVEGVVRSLRGSCEYPDLAHPVQAYRVEFQQHVDRQEHGAAIWLEGSGLLGMLIATQNQPGGICRALVYPA
jgi:hypothetical protein